jgi:hypothetical protein
MPIFSAIGQGNKPVRSITLDQLLGKKKQDKVEQPVTKLASNATKGGYREHIGAIGSVLERVELKGTSLSQDKISTPYRRYVVKGIMDLGGKTISMPDGCILDLEQGSLKNGSLKMNTTLVTPIYGISKERNISKVKVSGEYYETLVDLWGEQTEPLFPWDTTAPRKVYIVDLKKFGITPGYQKRGNDNHYTDKQYDLMYNNGIGFTKAIRWAYDNGYDGIRFPKNDYCFTPRTTKNDKPQEGPMVLVQDYDKYDIDLGGGSYYLILDSKKKSKYFALNHEKLFAQGGTMFFVAACINLQIHNGKLFGDRTLRNYDDGAEKNIENTYGINLSGYCQNIRLHHLEMCDFMGDGISCTQSGVIWQDYNGGFHSLQRSYPGVSKPLNNNNYSTVSGFLSLTNLYKNPDAIRMGVIQRIAANRVYSLNNNLGYTRLINPFHNLEILTFSDIKLTEKPLRIIKTSYLESFFLNDNETYVKVCSSFDEGATEEGLQHSETISELISSHVIIENCTIQNNHRGGISGGSNDVTIRNCRFFKNHEVRNIFGKTIPLFLVGGTNYHINFEDSYAKDLKIYDCSFHRTSNSIGKLLFGVYTLDFHHNQSDAPMSIYNSIHSYIHNNSFSSSALWLNDWRLTNYDDGLKKHGFKYLTRIAYVTDNEIRSHALIHNHNRSIVWETNNT